jgi:hypothetical protein
LQKGRFEKYLIHSTQKAKAMNTVKISSVITPVNGKFGAPMGRSNIGIRPTTITSGPHCRIFKKNQVKVYRRRVHLSEGYDIGGAYWGIGSPLYVEFTKDLSFIEFKRA